jgi:hypothetical protein
VTTELALFRARLEDLSTKSAILEQRRLQKLNEIEELRIQYMRRRRMAWHSSAAKLKQLSRW